MKICNIRVSITPAYPNRDIMQVSVETNTDSFSYEIVFDKNEFESRFHQMIKEAELAITENIVKETKDDDDIV